MLILFTSSFTKRKANDLSIRPNCAAVKKWTPLHVTKGNSRYWTGGICIPPSTTFILSHLLTPFFQSFFFIPSATLQGCGSKIIFSRWCIVFRRGDLPHKHEILRLIYGKQIFEKLRVWISEVCAPLHSSSTVFLHLFRPSFPPSFHLFTPHSFIHLDVCAFIHAYSIIQVRTIRFWSALYCSIFFLFT